jgi:hypothetical protein
MQGMRMIQGTVLEGRVVLDDPLPEGSTVTVLLEEQTVAVLSPEDAAELADRIAAADRGDVIEYDVVDQMLRDILR